MRKIKGTRPKKYERKSFCGECLREIGGHWLRPIHLDDKTTICPSRKLDIAGGAVLTFDVDLETMQKIEDSGLDPRVHDYWEHHPAADGNKPYKTWRGKRLYDL